MDITTKQVEEVITKQMHDEEDFFYDLGYGSVKLEGLGETESLERHGGEGQGDQYWIVFKLGDQRFKASTGYDSWEGSHWDDWFNIEEVIEYKVTRKEYLTEGEAKAMKNSDDVEIEL